MANANPTQVGRAKTIVKQFWPILANEMATGVAGGGSATVTGLSPSAQKGTGVAYIDFGYRVAPTAGSIQISDGTLTWGPFTITLAGLQTRAFDPPLLFGKGNTVTVTLADGGQTKDLYVKFVEEGNEAIY